MLSRQLNNEAYNIQFVYFLGCLLYTHQEQSVKHRLVKIPDRHTGGGTKRRRCRECSKIRKRQLTTYMCAVCPDKPGLCAVYCFDKFHDQIS